MPMNRNISLRRRCSFSIMLLCISLGRTASANTPADFHLEYGRGACEGSCPEYSVDLDSTGHVTWQGINGVFRIGRDSKTVHPDTVAQIVALLRSLQLAGATRTIRCIDSPQYSISVRMDRVNASIVSTACGASLTPAELRVHQTIRSLDRLIGVESWISPPSKR